MASRGALLLTLIAFLNGAGVAQTDSARTASGLWYAQRGQGAALLLVHGSNLDSRSFDWIAPPLAEGRRVVVMDLRLHGRSTDPGGPVSWERDLLEVFDALGLVRASPPATERLDRLSAPLLVVVGDSDLTYAPKVADPLVQEVRGARRVTLQRCGHLAPVDCPRH
ncbi:MAG: hypothetical protein HYW52_03025 [Gemmatimonadetes bacterium]|nr:hypothetical protein [Gemmatimonadota bacterium]